VLRRCLVPLSLVALLAACGGDDGGSQAADPSPAPVPYRGTPIVITPLDARLVTPGSAPRSVLRHDLRTASTSTGEMTFALDVTGVLAVELVGPSTITVRAVDGRGTATADYALEGLDLVSTGEGDVIPSSVDAVDITGEVVVEADRTATSATVQTAASSDIPGLGAVARSVEPRITSLLFPFPSEPIGLGAEWQITGALPFFGTTVELDATARLVSRSAERFEISLAVGLASRPDAPGIVVDLSGSGAIVGRTDALVPRSGSLVVNGDVVLVGRSLEPVAATLELRIAGR